MWFGKCVVLKLFGIMCRIDQIDEPVHYIAEQQWILYIVHLVLFVSILANNSVQSGNSNTKQNAHKRLS